VGLDFSGVGAVATAAQKIVGMFFPDKTVEEQSKLSAALAMLTAQTDIDKTEAASSDPLQHWRGGLGWVCVAAYLYNFVLEPLMEGGAVIVTGHQLPFPILNIEPLATLTLGMLGLGALHVAERVKGAA
jgi:hypothetical protein